MPTLRAQLLGKPSFFINGNTCKFTLKKSEATLGKLDLPPVLASGSLLVEIFEELIRNAVEAMPDG